MPRSPAPPVAKLRPSTKLAHLGALEFLASLPASMTELASLRMVRPGEFRVASCGGMQSASAIVYAVSDEERA